MLVTLSGLDGAGKSTLAHALRSRLEKNGIPATIFHMNKDVGLYAYLRKTRDAVKRLILLPQPQESAEQVPTHSVVDTKSESHAGSVKATFVEVRRRVIWNKSLRRWIDLWDLGTFLFYRLFIERSRGRVLIMDRYFYDRMADIADARRWSYLRWFCRITPVPDVPVFVRVAPEEAYARKGEYSVESMTRRSEIYEEIFSWIPGAIFLPNDAFDAAADSLEQIVSNRMRLAGHQRLAPES